MKKMKFFKGITLLAIAFVAVLGSCVDNDFDIPAAREIPVGDVVTIAQLKTFFTDSGAVNINSAVGVAYEFKRDITVYATVTMDDKTGNLYEMAYIQDPTGGIVLKFDVPGGIQEGDTIRLNVKGLVINQYAKAFQINAIHGEGFKKENYITTIDVNKFRIPEIATIAQITNAANKAYYQGRLVKIENTQFVAGDTMQTYADAENFISRNLNVEQADGATLLVRTSGYASFADEKSPKGSGSIIGVMGQFNNDMQLQIRKTSEVDMKDERLFIKKSILSLDFFGEDKYMYETSIVGDQKWLADSYGYAKMTGYSGSRLNNEDWLITSVLNFSGKNNVVLNFRHAAGYVYTGVWDDLQLLVSTNYTGEGDPNNASWTSYTFIAPPVEPFWTWVDSGDIDLSAYDGESNVYFAFKYVSNTTDCATWEVDNVVLQESVK